MKDMLGNELAVGDFVAYGARSGNTGELRVGIIVNTDKAQLLTGRGYHKVWDWKTKTEVDEYHFDMNYTVGTGVHGERLLKLDPKSHMEIYTQLLEKAKLKKWL